MWIGWTEIEVLLGDVRSLKAKRSVVRPVIAQLRRTGHVAVAETAHHDLHRRAAIGISTVAPDRARIAEVLAAAEATVLDHPELEVLSSRTRILAAEDVE